MGTTPRIIVLKDLPPSEKTIQQALSGNAGHPIYQAIVAKIDALRWENATAAATSARQNNGSAADCALGAFQALTELLSELDSYVNESVEET